MNTADGDQKRAIAPSAQLSERANSGYWMRSVSFAGLHRVLCGVAQSRTKGLRPSEIVEWVRNHNVRLGPNSRRPSRTTIYHYRNTLLQMGALRRVGKVLRANEQDRDVRALLGEVPKADAALLSQSSRKHFAALVYRVRECRELFFDLFLSEGLGGDGVSDFMEHGQPVEWTREPAQVTFRSPATGQVACFKSPSSIQAVLYGIRYWARDELQLIDEYPGGAGDRIVMFPVQCRRADKWSREHLLHLLRAEKREGDWTLVSIADLIVRYCEEGRRPLSVLFDAIDWLRRTCPDHTVLLPTSRAVPTLTASSPQRERLVLRRCYKPPGGPYVSHFRWHRGLELEQMESVADENRSSL